MPDKYDAILIIGFGGPEGPDDVIPFLENVLRGKRVPRERMLEVAEHYYHFGGISPINQQVRDLIEALKPALSSAGVDLPVYWGNRNWHPMLTDTLQQMKEDGIENALAVVISAFSSYSGCRQYREDVIRAQEEIGEGAPNVRKIRVFYNHPGFIEASTAQISTALENHPDRKKVRLVFTAHSIPNSMADTSDYVKQLTESCRLIAEQLDWPEDQYDLVYQSRSGRPEDPWLEPDILDHLKDLHEQKIEEVVIYPLGFLSDHMEVLFDLDTEAKDLCTELGMKMTRALTVGTHPAMVKTWVELIQERLSEEPVRKAIGCFGPNHDVCPENCCPAPRRPVSRT